MARIPLAQPNHTSLSSELISAMKERRGGTLAAIDRLLIHNESVALAWNAMFGALASDSSIEFRIREIAVLRVAWLTGARYPLHQHRRIARTAGLSDGEIEALRDWRDSGLFDPREQAVLAYVDAMTAAVQVPDEVFRALRAHFDARQLVGLTATVAAYNMAGRFMEALELGPEDSFPAD